VNGNISEVAES